MWYPGQSSGGSSTPTRRILLTVANHAFDLATAGVTTEQSFPAAFDCVVPAAYMGAGSILEVVFCSTNTNNANVKTIRAKIGGTIFMSLAVTSQNGSLLRKALYAKTDTTQWALPTNINDGTTASGVPQTKTYDFSVDQTINLFGELATATDSVVCNFYQVSIINPAS